MWTEILEQIQRRFRLITTSQYLALIIIAYFIHKYWTKPTLEPIPKLDIPIRVQHWTIQSDLSLHQSIATVDFQLITEDLSTTLNDGEALFETLFVSIDKYTILSGDSSFGKRLGKFNTMSGEACSRVIKSRNEALPVGMFVLSNSGWRTHFISSNNYGEIRPILFTDIGNISPSITLSYLGMPGLTALFALDTIKPNSGDVVAIGGADGTFGSVFGQLAKEKGCKIIGFASTDERVEWLKNVAGFDFAFNNKTIDMESAMMEVIPNRVNIFFDHIGEEFYTTMARDYMAFGSMTICPVWPSMKELEDCIRISSKWNTIQGRNRLSDLIQRGTLKYQEIFIEGFNQLPQALIDVLNGKNNGEAVVKIL